MDDRSGWGVTTYRPITPTEENPGLNNAIGFHKSKATIRVIIGANRSGKTEAMMAEMAALALGAPFPDWFNWDGNPEPPLTIWLVLNQFPKSARGDARLKKLYFGERKLIDGVWTSCQPFIPPEMIAENPGNNFQNVTLKNGTTIIVKSTMQADLAMASDNVDLIVIDEPTEDEKWGEFVSRIIASPIARLIHGLTDAWLTTDYLDHLLESEDEELDVERFDFTTEGNPHTDRDRAKKVFKLQTREQRMVRELGMRKKDTLLCYPKVFRWLNEGTGREIHRRDGTTGNWVKPFPIPSDWTRYVVHDPGSRHPAATVWFAVQPWTNDIYAYRCCHIREPGGDVNRVCDLISQANNGEEIHSWFMDPKAGRSRPRNFIWASLESTIDVYRRISENYPMRWGLGPPHLERAFRDSRIQALTSYLNPEDKAFPMMYFFDVKDGLSPERGVGGMECLKNEFRHYRRDERTGNPVPEKDDAIYCCEAAAVMQLKNRGVANSSSGWQTFASRPDPVESFMNGSLPERWSEEP